MIIQKGKNKAIQINLSEFRGKNFIQISEMYNTDENKEWKYTKKNITLNDTTYPQFIQYLNLKHNEIMEHLLNKVDNDEIKNNILNDLKDELNDDV